MLLIKKPYGGAIAERFAFCYLTLLQATSYSINVPNKRVRSTSILGKIVCRHLSVKLFKSVEFLFFR